MKIDGYSLNDAPFSDNFVIQFPFPNKERKKLLEALTSIDDLILFKQIENARDSVLEQEIALKLEPMGYFYSENHPEKCQLWLPDYGHEADFYNPIKKISIEVEKTEVKRVVHDVLKLVNGSMTFVPRVRYGVLIIPDRYVRSSGKDSPFFSIVKRQIPFYFQKIIPENCHLHDVLILVYHID